jgi:hypothetical protein
MTHRKMMVAHIPPVRNSRTLEIKSSCQKKQDGGHCGLAAGVEKNGKRKSKWLHIYDRVTVSLWFSSHDGSSCTVFVDKIPATDSSN